MGITCQAWAPAGSSGPFLSPAVCKAPAWESLGSCTFSTPRGNPRGTTWVGVMERGRPWGPEGRRDRHGSGGPGGQPGPSWSSCTTSPLPEAWPWRDCPGTCQVERSRERTPSTPEAAALGLEGLDSPRASVPALPPLLLPLLLLFLLFLTPNRELHARAVIWKCQLLPKAGDWLRRTPLSLKGLCLAMALG